MLKRCPPEGQNRHTQMGAFKPDPSGLAWIIKERPEAPSMNDVKTPASPVSMPEAKKAKTAAVTDPVQISRDLTGLTAKVESKMDELESGWSALLKGIEERHGKSPFILPQ